MENIPYARDTGKIAIDAQPYNISCITSYDTSYIITISTMGPKTKSKPRRKRTPTKPASADPAPKKKARVDSKQQEDDDDDDEVQEISKNNDDNKEAKNDGDVKEAKNEGDSKHEDGAASSLSSLLSLTSSAVRIIKKGGVQGESTDNVFKYMRTHADILAFHHIINYINNKKNNITNKEDNNLWKERIAYEYTVAYSIHRHRIVRRRTFFATFYRVCGVVVSFVHFVVLWFPAVYATRTTME